MVDLQRHDIEESQKQAAEYELGAQRSRRHSAWLKNEVHAAELRRRIEVLKRRLAKLDHNPEK